MLGKCGLSALAITLRMMTIITRAISNGLQEKIAAALYLVIVVFGLAGCMGKGKARAGNVFTKRKFG